MELVRKYKGFILYVVFGVATTVVNIAVYYVGTEVLGIGNVFSNVAAWIAAVTFAYFTNRKWVFESAVEDLRGIIREVLYFYGCRLLTGFLDLAVMYVSVDLMHFSGMTMKCIANVLVILANYIASKLVIFKKVKEE